jgi:V/A-type H+-transporting ATPase subunit B
MKDAIGKGKTHPAHPKLAQILPAQYANVADVRMLASIMGEADLTPNDKEIIAFGEAFEQEFVHQEHGEIRALDETLALGKGLVLGEM